MISANAISLQSPPVAVPTQVRPAAGRGDEAGGGSPAPAEAQTAQAAPSSSGSAFRGVNLDITA